MNIQFIPWASAGKPNAHGVDPQPYADLRTDYRALLIKLDHAITDINNNAATPALVTVLAKEIASLSESITTRAWRISNRSESA